MSTELFNKKIDEARKLQGVLQKDMDYRVQLERQKKPVFQLDAEIRGSFLQLEQLQEAIQMMFNNYRANPKDFGFTNRELDKRGEVVASLKTDLISSKNRYDSFFVIKRAQTEKQKEKVSVYENMDKKQLIEHKEKQEKDQEEILDELIGVVKNTKKGNKDIEEVLDDQDKQLNELGEAMDLNMHKMGKVKRGMMKLLDGSSNLCLIFAILIEIAALICMIIFW